MNNQQTNNNIVEELQPYAGKVNIEVLLNQIEQYISQHAVLPNGASVAITLWCLASYNINNFHIFPRLFLTSPVKRCGKSTVLDLIEAFSNKSFIVSNISTAALFRTIEICQPTLIIDEADTFVANRNDDMIGIINSGHGKSRANVIRCTGQDNNPTKFSTWTPMVLAGIGDLKDTIMDRSVTISLERKRRNQTVTRVPVDLYAIQELNRQKLLKWSTDNEISIKLNTIDPPNLGNDRAADNWLPLFTLANQVSDIWLKKCEAAYLSLTIIDDESDLSSLLLGDIRDIFNKHNDIKISSADLVNKLTEDKDKLWCEYKNGKALTQSSLATILKPFNIKSSTIRIQTKTLRGYELNQFKNTFDIYLPPLP